MIEVFLILAFVFLQLSLLATTIQEIWASMSSARGRMLKMGLSKMLDDPMIKKSFSYFKKQDKAGQLDSSYYKKFTQDIFYTQKINRSLGLNRLPSYLEPSTFRRILFQLIFTSNDTVDANQSEENQHKKKTSQQHSETAKLSFQNSFSAFEAAVNNNVLPNNKKLGELLGRLLDEARYEGVSFDQKIEQWYNEMMARMTGWYKRKVQFHLIIIGLLIAFIFDADTLEMYQKLSTSPEKEFYANAITSIVESKDSITIEEFDTLSNAIFDDLQTPVGMGGIKDAFANELFAHKATEVIEINEDETEFQSFLEKIKEKKLTFQDSIFLPSDILYAKDDSIFRKADEQFLRKDDTYSSADSLLQMQDSVFVKTVTAIKLSGIKTVEYYLLKAYRTKPLRIVDEKVFIDPLSIEADSSEITALRAQLYYTKGIDFCWGALGLKFLGWLITALLISLGAPFWFDLLKKLVHVRNAGKRPEINTSSSSGTAMSSPRYVDGERIRG